MCLHSLSVQLPVNMKIQTVEKAFRVCRFAILPKYQLYAYQNSPKFHSEKNKFLFMLVHYYKISSSLSARCFQCVKCSLREKVEKTIINIMWQLDAILYEIFSKQQQQQIQINCICFYCVAYLLIK